MQTQLKDNKYYYPFGMGMNNRKYQSGDGYRYGFSGKEAVKEIDGNESTYEFDLRFYDVRTGRFLSIDPLTTDFPNNSPYCFAENDPIRFIELEGKEIAEPDLFLLAQAMLGQLESEVSSSGLNSTVFAGVTRMDIIAQLKSKLQNPACAISVGNANHGGWYCGTAADMVVAANYNPMAYVSTVWDLATTGHVNAMGGKKVTINVPDWLKTAGLSGGKVGSVDVVDYILRMTLRASENKDPDKPFLTYNPTLEGTPPWEQDNQLARLGLGVKTKTYYTGQTNRDLKKIEKAVKGGYLPIVFETHLISSGVVEKTDVPLFGELNVGIHYLVITHFERDKHNKTITLKYVSYGKEYEKTISYKEFKQGMKGYWIPRNKKDAGGKEKK